MSEPVKKFKCGPIEIAVWASDQGGYSFSLRKSYKDKAGQWQDAKTFYASDLPVIRDLLRAAFEYSLKSTSPGQPAATGAARQAPRPVTRAAAPAPVDSEDIPF